ncbi:Small-conductance mechanosensitive channel [Paenibacillus sp. CECT 9249]|uniref:mechanosensitive ion channel family protein n=1 Tax=Paenibacillus sp. CECT 9249 TaxID=2845385 RepID=UPI001E4DC6D6|nr:mechanosensitive ion channel family protein [Paenibacillus sp. CECT 9249]CAH0121865.1 Small-conductance mechanosensitive channel [Paenibacillus sp. CECT 9249]
MYKFHEMPLAESSNIEAEIQEKLNVFQQFWNYVTSSETWGGYLWSLIDIVIIFIVTRAVIAIVHRIIDHTMSKKEKMRLNVNSRRMVTVAKLLKNVTFYTLNFIMLLLVLAEFNINLGPLLAGAGVVGLAIGFGAQSLVKDVITGFFIIFEDQFAVGDIIETGKFRGTVEVIGLRSTRIKNWTGEVHIIPNGMINEVTNFSLENSIAVIDIAVAYEEDAERTIQIIKETVEPMVAEIEDLLKVPEVLGVQTFGSTGVTIRVIAECKPYTHYGVTRIINARLKKALDAKGIDIPYPRLVTYQRAGKGGMNDGT